MAGLGLVLGKYFSGRAGIRLTVVSVRLNDLTGRAGIRTPDIHGVNVAL